MQKDNTVFVTGAGGFIGEFTVKELLKQGYSVLGLTRRTPTFDLSNSKFEWIYGDLMDSNILNKSTERSFAVVHLAAITSERNSTYEESYKINVIGTKNLVESCKRNNIDRIISLSSESTKREFKGVYAKTKQESDQVVIDSDLRWTIIKPTIVYGPGKKGVFAKLNKNVKSFPIIPIIGNGRYGFYPIYVEDVANAIVSTIKNTKTINKTYDIAGPNRVSFDAIIDGLLDLNNKKALKIHVPICLCKIIARLVSIFPNPPITMDNIYGSVQEIIPDLTPAKKDFDFKGTSFFEGLKKSYGEQNPGGN